MPWEKEPMITWSFVGILALVFFIPFRARLLWDNYKGRFRYGLREHSSYWRRLDGLFGAGSLLFDIGISILVIVALSYMLFWLFAISLETSSSIVFSGSIGWTFVNMAYDKISVDRFERNCLTCENTEECMRFHELHCKDEAMSLCARVSHHLSVSIDQTFLRTLSTFSMSDSRFRLSITLPSNHIFDSSSTST